MWGCSMCLFTYNMKYRVSQRRERTEEEEDHSVPAACLNLCVCVCVNVQTVLDTSSVPGTKLSFNVGL